MLVFALSVLALCVWAPSALAGEMYVSDLGNVVFEAYAGEANNLGHIDELGTTGKFTITDFNNAIVIPAGETKCAPDPNDPKTVMCQPDNPTQIVIEIDLGDRDDNVWLEGTTNDAVIDGGLGADTLRGGSGDDDISTGDASGAGGNTLRGGPGHDVLSASGSADFLDGEAGHDELNGGAGASRLNGGFGMDTFNGGTGSEEMHGGQDQDAMNGGGGQDTIHGDAGGDTINGGADSDTLYGDEHDDTIRGGAGSDTLSGGDGNDDLDGEEGGDTVRGGLGADTFVDSGVDDDGGWWGTDDMVAFQDNDFTAPGQAARTAGVSVTVGDGNANDGSVGEGDEVLDGFESIVGSAYADDISGSGEDERLDGLDGNDVLRGRGGSDRLYGGAGADDFHGGTDLDGSDRDEVNYFDRWGVQASIDGVANDGQPVGSGEGDNVRSDVEALVGSPGQDTLTGSDGADWIDGDFGNDTIDGRGGGDSLVGREGADTLIGGAGSDSLQGDDGNDTLRGRHSDRDWNFDCGNDTDTVEADHELYDANASISSSCEDVQRAGEAPKPDTQVFASPQPAQIGEEVTFSASPKDAGSARATDYRWDLNNDGSFGDGSPTAAFPDGSGSRIKRTFATAGTKTVKVQSRFQGDDGSWAVAETTFEVLGDGTGGDSHDSHHPPAEESPAEESPTEPAPTQPAPTQPSRIRVGNFVQTQAPTSTVQRVPLPNFEPRRRGSKKRPRWQFTSETAAGAYLARKALNIDLDIKRIPKAKVPDALQSQVSPGDIVAQSPTRKKVPFIETKVSAVGRPILKVTVYDATKDKPLKKELRKKGCGYLGKDKKARQLREALVGPLHTGDKRGAADLLKRDNCEWRIAKLKKSTKVSETTVTKASRTKVVELSMRKGRDRKSKVTVVGLKVVEPRPLVKSGIPRGQELAIVLSTGQYRNDPSGRNSDLALTYTNKNTNNIAFVKSTSDEYHAYKATVVARASGNGSAVKLKGATVEVIDSNGRSIDSKTTDAKGEADFLKSPVARQTGKVTFRATGIGSNGESVEGSREVPVVDFNCSSWRGIDGRAFKGVRKKGKCYDNYEQDLKAGAADVRAHASVAPLLVIGGVIVGVAVVKAIVDRNAADRSLKELANRKAPAANPLQHVNAAKYSTCSLGTPPDGGVALPKLGLVESVLLTPDGTEIGGVMPVVAASTGDDCLVGPDGSIMTGDAKFTETADVRAAKIIAPGGGNIIAAGGGNIISTGGGNIIAPGGGNIIAPGGGNIISTGGGNIIAAGGGNIISTGGGNIISTGGGNIISTGGGN